MKHLLLILSILLLSSPVIGDNHKDVKWNDKTFTETSPTGVLIRKILGTTTPFDVKGETLYRWKTTFWFIPTGFEWKTMEDLQRENLLEYNRIRQGREHYPKYVGDIENGEPNGFGMIIGYPDSEDWYVGEWKDGMFHGQGKYTNPNGEEYVGKWKDGEKHGQGTQIRSNGNKYVGEWKNGRNHGQGTFTFSSGQKYVGGHREGKFHGQGTWTYPNGTNYVGEFKDGIFNGQGTFSWSNGEKYVGEYKDGEEWNGTKIDKNGNILYKYVNGKMIIQ